MRTREVKEEVVLTKGWVWYSQPPCSILPLTCNSSQNWASAKMKWTLARLTWRRWIWIRSPRNSLSRSNPCDQGQVLLPNYNPSSADMSSLFRSISSLDKTAKVLVHKQQRKGCGCLCHANLQRWQPLVQLLFWKARDMKRWSQKWAQHYGPTSHGEAVGSWSKRAETANKSDLGIWYS